MTGANRNSLLLVTFALITAFIVLAVASPASAALGGDEASVETDRAHMRGAQLRMVRAGRYTVHEMQAESGTVVREYVSPGGRVFAVAWQGPRLPDMRQLMGAYFDQYTEAARAARAKRSGHGPLLIEEGGLVVQNAGHMRAFAGRAYLAHLVPDGVVSDDIR